MKVGVLTFGYEGFEQFSRQVAERGFFTANLGDNMQSIAVGRALGQRGVGPERAVSIDRDTARHYDGPPIALVSPASTGILRRFPWTRSGGRHWDISRGRWPRQASCEWRTAFQDDKAGARA